MEGDDTDVCPDREAGVGLTAAAGACSAAGRFVGPVGADAALRPGNLEGAGPQPT